MSPFGGLRAVPARQQNGQVPTDWLDSSVELRTAYDLAVAAGHLLANRPSLLTTDSKTTHTDIVTQMDRASETLLAQALAQAFPDDGVLGEEGTDHVSSSGRQWVLDPLDGTVNYFYGLPHWAVSVALVDERTREGLVGVVHAPLLGLTMAAQRGKGARRIQTRGTQSIAISQCPSLDRALVGTGFGYSPERRAGQARTLTQVLPQVRDIRRIGSCAIDLCLVACGELDAYYERGVSEWDFAAGGLIVTEAGGYVTGLRGLPPGPEMTVAAPPVLHGALTAILEAADADTD